ncbi:MAG: L-histidine N(alpha)-methyltransferase [Candidatus Binatia bacterium]
MSTHPTVASNSGHPVALPHGGSLPAELWEARLRVDVHLNSGGRSALAFDVRRGLSLRRKMLPPKYFYDAYGSQLFDAICDLPEYYLTRTEYALLAAVADEIVGLAAPDDLVEFGSGASRKTRLLLDALGRAGLYTRYVPMDVSESMLRCGAQALLADYPEIQIHAVVGDYERHLDRLPRGRHRLVAFLGSTIGNFTPAEADRFLRRVADRMHPGEHFLLGVDLIKDLGVLQSAYNDAGGVTAEFNRNILRVVNRDLDADFDPSAFEHVAFFNVDASQIEMHLRACEAHTVQIHALNLAITFAAGETILTEISRKFTRRDTEAMLRRAGFEPVRWFEPANGYFGLALVQRRGSSPEQTAARGFPATSG